MRRCFTNLYTSPNSIRVIRSKLARLSVDEKAHNILFENLKDRHHLEDLGLDFKVILIKMLKK
jgi:hypothetical protein